jgi:hypothetical protein
MPRIARLICCIIFGLMLYVPAVSARPATRAEMIRLLDQNPELRRGFKTPDGADAQVIGVVRGGFQVRIRATDGTQIDGIFTVPPDVKPDSIASWSDLVKKAVEAFGGGGKKNNCTVNVSGSITVAPGGSVTVNCTQPG